MSTMQPDFGIYLIIESKVCQARQHLTCDHRVALVVHKHFKKQLYNVQVLEFNKDVLISSR